MLAVAMWIRLPASAEFAQLASTSAGTTSGIARLATSFAARPIGLGAGTEMVVSVFRSVDVSRIAPWTGAILTQLNTGMVGLRGTVRSRWRMAGVRCSFGIGIIADKKVGRRGR